MAVVRILVGATGTWTAGAPSFTQFTTVLDSAGVTLSVAAFRKLSPPLRRRFRKHTPPVTYIRAEDPRRFR